MCYVICNEIVQREIGGWFGQYPYNAYFQLTRIFCSEKTRELLPKELQPNLKCSFALPSSELKRQLAGYCDDWIQHIVSLEVEVTDHPTRPVVLKDIYYQNHDMYSKFGPFNLSLREAFLLFANIMTNIFVNLDGLNDTSLEQFLGKHQKSMDNIRTYFGEDYIYMMKFSHCYYQYLKNELLSGRITPYEIAFYSGTSLLASMHDLKPVQEFIQKAYNDLTQAESISRTQKIIYYCLLLGLCDYTSIKDQYHLEKMELITKFESV